MKLEYKLTFAEKIKFLFDGILSVDIKKQYTTKGIDIETSEDLTNSYKSKKLSEILLQENN